MTEHTSSTSFAHLLRRYRRAAGLTQEQLAEQAGLSARAVSDLERGENRAPRRDTLDLLAAALRLSPDDRAALDATVVRIRAGTIRTRPGASLAPDPVSTPGATYLDRVSSQPMEFVGREHAVTAIRGRADASVLPATGVRTFLIADVRGYTRFTWEHGHDAAAHLAARFADVVCDGLAGTDGEVVDLRGDEATLVFGSVRQALRTALALQERFSRELAIDSVLPLRVAMGLDAGEATTVTGAYRGAAFNLAAQLCAAATGGDVLVSEAVVHLAGTVEGLTCVERGTLTLKGVDVPVRALQILPVPFVAVVADAATDTKEHTVVERLFADLRGAGVACWNTTSVVKAEGAAGLRAGVRACRAVLCVGAVGTVYAHPAAATLEVAEVYRRPVVIAWLEGDDDDHRSDMPLMERVYTLDLRGERYAAALPRLVALLEQVEEFVGIPLEPVERDDPAAPTVGAPPRNPYKGLRTFREEDANDFFGRAALVAELVAAVVTFTRPNATRFLAVVGPSGSGKSSVVLAGLLPQLRHGALPGSREWVYLAPLVPGVHPLEALAVAFNNALPDSSLTSLQADLKASTRGLHLLASRLAPAPASRVVLVVDQTEEIFTLTADEDERRHVIDLLVTAVTEPRGSLLVILTLRADFYDRPLAYPALGRLIDAQSRAVLPMEPAELRAAIEGPAALPDVALRFERDLVGDLVYEVRDQVGALPLLQFTLDQLYERREGHTLIEAAYHDLGSVRGALARHAETTYAALHTADDRILARALFLRLIEPGPTERDATRRRAALAELEFADATLTAAMGTVVEAFIMNRLLTTTESAGTRTLEVSHEALIREWVRLDDWLREAREDVRLQGRIIADAATWERHGRPVDGLYRGTVLIEAQGWAARNTPSVQEAAFLEEATAAVEQQAENERIRQARELAVERQAAAATKRAATRLRTLVGMLVVFLLVASGLSVVALGNASQADNARNLAIGRQLAAESGNLLGSQPDLALLLSLEANRKLDNLETRGSLLRAVSGNRPFAILQGHKDTVIGMAFSASEHTLVSAGADRTLRFWDTTHTRLIGSPLAALDTIVSFTLSHNGRLFAIASLDGTIRIWDVRSRRVVGPPLRGQHAVVRALAFSPNGKLLATGSDDGTVRVWAVTHRQSVYQALTASQQAGGVYALTFSPDSKTLYASGYSGAITIWNMAAGAPSGAGVLTGAQQQVNALAISPDGKILAAASNYGTVWLYDTSSQQSLGAPLNNYSGFQDSVAFSPDGQTLAVGSGTGTIQLWDVRSHTPSGPPLQGGRAVTSLAFSPNGATLASNNGTTIFLWKIAQLQPLATTLTGDTSPVSALAFSPNGKILYSSSYDAMLRRWRLPQERPIGTLVPFQSPAMTISRDGRFLATGGNDGSVIVWDVTGGQPHLVSEEFIGSYVESVAFSPDGKFLAAGSDGKVAWLWDVTHAGLLSHGSALQGHTRNVYAVAFSPDGRLLASASLDGTIRLWDVAYRKQSGYSLVVGVGGACTLSFSPDGSILADGGCNDGTIRLWDVAHHRLLGLPLQMNSDNTSGLVFSPDGTLLATSGDQYIQLWNVASHQALGPPLTGHTLPVLSLAFSPDGKTLVSGSGDTTIKLWDTTLTGWRQLACRIANRNLTRQEWQQYLGDEPYRKTCPDLPAWS